MEHSASSAPLLHTLSDTLSFTGAEGRTGPPGWAKAIQGGGNNKEPTVRTDSLVEQRGFELPVLFVVPGAYERLEVSAGFTALKPIRRIILRAILPANSGPYETMNSPALVGSGTGLHQPRPL